MTAITLETGRCAQGCKMPYLSITYEKGGYRFGLRLRGCGGPYRVEREVEPRALRSLHEARRAELPIDNARLLADLQREAQEGIASLIREGQISREDGEAFLDDGEACRAQAGCPVSRFPGLEATILRTIEEEGQVRPPQARLAQEWFWQAAAALQARGLVVADQLEGVVRRKEAACSA